ncbi:hypothetical protein [Ralstonia chuxiongensis]|uniref:hypothetical protein n=1 Tax=Ralstonia chuxiongensis TaxID=2957504 RepID=UPI0028F586EC|nr:hypothetical protein [Ralstonia chuxiongensis]CAJ0776319.1 hypothetical protein R8510_04227 [Ralstonia chuxiongensis]
MAIKKNEQLHQALCKGLKHVVQHNDRDTLERALKSVTGKVTTAHVAAWVETFTPFKVETDKNSALTLRKPDKKLDKTKLNIEEAGVTPYWSLSANVTSTPDPKPRSEPEDKIDSEADARRSRRIKRGRVLSEAAFLRFLDDPSNGNYSDLIRYADLYRRAARKSLKQKRIYVSLVQGGAPGLGKRA